MKNYALKNFFFKREVQNFAQKPASMFQKSNNRSK